LEILPTHHIQNDKTKNKEKENQKEEKEVI
jgi:hypothetical protein